MKTKIQMLAKALALCACFCLLFGWVIRWVFVPGFPPGTPGTWVPIIAPPQKQNTNGTTVAVATIVRVAYAHEALIKGALGK